jgi:sec-independent protein translocase protein TatA
VIGLPEILVILLIVLLIFGGRRIPQLGRALGSGLRNLREHAGGKPSEDSLDPGEPASPPESGQPADTERSAKRG